MEKGCEARTEESSQTAGRAHGRESRTRERAAAAAEQSNRTDREWGVGKSARRTLPSSIGEAMVAAQGKAGIKRGERPDRAIPDGLA